MSSTAARQTPSAWQNIALEKQARRDAQIEACIGADAVRRLLVRNRPNDDHGTTRSLLDIPNTCGVLNAEEVEITQTEDATLLLEQLRSGKLSCVDVTRAFCKRAAIAQCLTNCLTEPLFDRARPRAAELDKHFSAHGRPVGPLHGLPMTVKDTFRIPGIDSSIGIASLCNDPATTTSPLIDLLERAGAVIIAKTNVPQTLMALDSHNNVFGRTINPAHPALTTGGSSGGEGACVAMRGSLVGIGTDVGGSIRIPAMCNGLVGLKPSAGRVPFADQQTGVAPGTEEIGIKASAGPICHSIRDMDLVMSVLSGRAAADVDPGCVPLSWRLVPVAGRRPRRKLRIGVVRGDGVTRPLPPIARFMQETITRLGASPDFAVVELSIEHILKRCASLVNKIFSIDGANHIFDLLEATGEPLSPWLQGRLKRRPRASLERVRELHAARTELQRDFSSIWRPDSGHRSGHARRPPSQSSLPLRASPGPTARDDGHGRDASLDLLIMPMAPHPTPRIDAWNTAAYTAVWTLLDLPATTLPVRTLRSDDLLPVGGGETFGDEAAAAAAAGVLSEWDRYNRRLWTEGDNAAYLGTRLCLQVVGRRLREEELLAGMAALERALESDSMLGERAKW